MKQSNQVATPKLVIALDVATKISGVAIFYEQILIATWSLVLNPDLKFGANKVVADLDVIEELLTTKVVKVLNFLKAQHLQIDDVGLIIEQSLHDHHNVSQKIHFYSGLMIATLHQCLVQQLVSFKFAIKMLPPSEWMLRLFNQQLDRQAGKNFSKQQALNLIYQQQPYLKHYYQLDHPWYYDYSAYDDNQADAINIGFNYQALRDVATIKMEAAKQQVDLKKIKALIKRLQTKIAKYDQTNFAKWSPREQQNYLNWQSELTQAKQQLLQLQQPVLIDPTKGLNPVSTIDYHWQDRLIDKFATYQISASSSQLDPELIKSYLVQTFKRKYYCNQDYVINDHHVVIINDQMNVKKITGSRFNITCNVGQFDTLFSVWCKYWNLDLPVFNQKYVNAGNVIEDLLVKWLESPMGRQYLNRFEAPVVTIKAIKGADCNWDYFANHQRFGGIPDAIATLANQREVILEFKSANLKKYQIWKQNGIPQSYIDQAMLYGYLNQSEDFVIINYWLEDDDYQNLEQLEINPERIYSGWFKCDHLRITTLIKQANSQYETYYQQRQSPWISNLSNDQKLLDYLTISDQDQYRAYLWKQFLDFVNDRNHPFDPYTLLTNLWNWLNKRQIS